MQSVTFALPTLSTTGMSSTDQYNLMINQVTAAIVCGYLEHQTAVISQRTSGAPIPNNISITQEQLVSLINSVQVALRDVNAS